MTTDEVKNLILSFLPDAQVEVEDMRGTGDHFDVCVTSKVFQGKSILEQHRLVFKGLESYMDKGLHAVQLKTKIAN